jgi:polyhydroxybutyrate depolymerase
MSSGAGAAGGTATACGATAVQPPGVTTLSMEHDGLSREYRLAVPEITSASTSLPLIVNFHGFGSRADLQAGYSRLEDKGPRRGFVVVTPQGTGDPAYWDTTPADGGPDDLGFAAALVDAVAAQVCIDRTRVFATGFSNGARMATYWGCEPATELAAVAPVGGVNLYGTCPRGRPLGVLTFHGRRDENVPYGGGRDVDAGPPALKPSIPSTMRSWARRDRCRADPVRRQVSTHVRRAVYRGCAGGTGVVLYTVTDGGHTWPGAADLPDAGITTHEIDASDLILDFFETQERRAS